MKTLKATQREQQSGHRAQQGSAWRLGSGNGFFGSLALHFLAVEAPHAQPCPSSSISVRELEIKPKNACRLAGEFENFARERSQGTRSKLDDPCSRGVGADRFAVFRDNGPGTFRDLRDCKPPGRPVDSAAQQKRSLMTIELADAGRCVHSAFQEAIHTEAGILDAHKDMPVRVAYRVLACRADNAAFIPPDRFRKRKSTCANQAENGADKRSDEAFAHGVLFPVADLIHRSAGAPET
jgi:hypothetical protein